MQEFNLNISDQEIPVKVEKHTRFRRCSMRITDYGLRVTVPSTCLEKEWKGFINKHRRWIYRTFSNHKCKVEKLPKLKEGAKIPFKGNFYTIKSGDFSNPAFSEDSFPVPCNLLKDREKLCEYLFNIYIDEGASLIKTFIDKWQSHFTKAVSAIKVKEMKSRWGSCSSKGNIALNWRLIMAPQEVFEYVFVHELCHLETKAHNRKFWLEVDARIPGAVIWRRLLKKNNYMLMNFPFPPKNPKTYFTFKLDNL